MKTKDIQWLISAVSQLPALEVRDHDGFPTGRTQGISRQAVFNLISLLTSHEVERIEAVKLHCTRCTWTGAGTVDAGCTARVWDQDELHDCTGTLQRD